MTLDTAVHILCEFHTRDDHQIGYTVEGSAGPALLTPYTQGEYIKAWAVLREHDHRPTKPEDYKP